jgi:hypothetical protein
MDTALANRNTSFDECQVAVNLSGSFETAKKQRPMKGAVNGRDLRTRGDSLICLCTVLFYCSFERADFDISR